MGFWQWDLATGAFLWDRQCQSLLGLSADTSMRFEQLFRITGLEERSLVENTISQAKTTPGNYQVELILSYQDGSHRSILLKFRSVSGVDRKPIRLSGVIQEVTQPLDSSNQKRLAKTLRGNEQRFRLATEALEGIVYEWDLVEGTIHRSAGVQELFW